MDPTGERFIPGQGGAQIAYEHLQRYLLAREAISGKWVLDLGSGEGYGAFLLAREARQVIGIDVSPDAVTHAATKYVATNLRFVVGSALAIPFRSKPAFDIVVCFEAIEHVADPEKLICEAKRVLRSDGVLLMSTPNKETYSDVPRTTNPYHVKEFYFHELRDLLRRHFKHVTFYGQRLAFGARIWNLSPSVEARRIGEQVVDIAPDGLFPFRDVQPAAGESRYFVAACSDCAVPEQLVYRAIYFTDESRLMHAEFEAALAAKDGHIRNLSAQITALSSRLADIQRTVGWKALGRLRCIRDRMVPPGTRRQNVYRAIRHLAGVWLDEGLVPCLRKVGHDLRRALGGSRLGLL